MDLLVHENERGRKLANQIVRQVFRPRGNKEEKLASGHRVSVFEAHIHMLIKQEVSPPYTIDPATSGYTFFYLFNFHFLPFLSNKNLNVRLRKSLKKCCAVVSFYP